MTAGAAIETTEAAPTGRYAKIAIAIFFVTLFIPGSFYVGVRLTPYRLYLIAMAIPMLLRFRSDPTLRINAVDVLVFLAAAWRALAILVNHQTSEIANASALFIEFFFGYLLARTFVRTAEDYVFFFRSFLVTLLAFTPFALVELVTHTRLLRELSGLLLTPPPIEVLGGHTRFGLLRVQVSFDHALHFGMFCAIGFAPVFYIYRSFFNKMIYSGFVVLMTLLAISSSSILALVLQMGLIAYDKIVRIGPWRWYILGTGALTFWFGFEALFSMSFVEFVVSNLVLNAHGAEGRLDQIVFSMKEIYGSPVFGIGMNQVPLPFWRGNILDNTWLRVAVQYGVPAFLLTVAVFVTHFFAIAGSRSLTEAEAAMRTGYLIGVVATVFLIGVITIWGIGLVFIVVLLGAGSWFYTQPRAIRLPGRRYAGPDARATRLRRSTRAQPPRRGRPGGARA